MTGYFKSQHHRLVAVWWLSVTKAGQLCLLNIVLTSSAVGCFVSVADVFMDRINYEHYWTLEFELFMSSFDYAFHGVEVLDFYLFAAF